MSLAAITFSQIIKISLFSSNITRGRIIFIWGEIFLRVLDIFPTIMCMTASVWVGQGSENVVIRSEITILEDIKFEFGTNLVCESDTLSDQ